MSIWEIEMRIDGGVVIQRIMSGETAADVIEEILGSEDKVEIRQIRVVQSTSTQTKGD